MVVMSVIMSELERAAQLRRMLDDGTAQAIRRRSGVSQADLARAVGVSRAAVSGWELRKRSPRRAEALRYHSALAGLVRALEQPDGALS